MCNLTSKVPFKYGMIIHWPSHERLDVLSKKNIEFKEGLGWLVNAYSCHSIQNAKEVGPQTIKGSFLGMQGGWFLGCKVGFASEPGGIMEGARVALLTITTWALM